jgi:sulfur carrier protein ThiS
MDEDLHQLTPHASQFMNYCRKIALMPEDRFVRHFRIQLSTTARRQLHTFPPINSQPLECLFPWEPTGFTPNTQLQERSPPLTNAPLPLPEQPETPVAETQVVEPQEEAEEIAPVAQENQVQPNVVPRRRPADDAEYNPGAAGTRVRRTRQERVNQAENTIEEVQRWLRIFAPKLNYNRQAETNQSSRQFETQRYFQLMAEQNDEQEEMIAKLNVDIVDNLAKALESESRARIIEEERDHPH